MGSLTKMLGTSIFLILSLSVLGFSIPQPEMRIIIHLHYDDFQPGPVRGPQPNIGYVGKRRPGIVPETYLTVPEGGSDYSDDDIETEDEDVIPNEEIELVGEDEEEEDGSGLDDQPVEPQAEEAGDDYSDHWAPQPYQGSYDNGAESGYGGHGGHHGYGGFGQKRNR